MKIILVGGGKVGTALARQLSEEGHNVTVVDTNKARVTCQEVKAVADAKLEQVEQKLLELTRFRENLKSLSDICCGGPRSAEHCAILETLESGAPSRHEHHDHEH